jgi:hypothetical protein
MYNNSIIYVSTDKYRMNERGIRGGSGWLGRKNGMRRR